MSNSKFSVDKLRSAVSAARDSQAGEFVVTTAALIEVLEAFLSGLIDKEDVAIWAEFFDANEDVELESDKLLPSIIFELSSPEINGYLDSRRAAQILRLLKQSV